MSQGFHPTPETAPLNVPENTLQMILQSLRGLRYGQVTVIVQDGRVLQIDRTERHRLTSGESPNS